LAISLASFWLVCEVDPGNAAVLVPLAEEVLIVEQRQFLDDVVHNEIGVDSRFTADDLLVSLAELDDLSDVKPLLRVQLKHPVDHSSQLCTVLFAKWRKLSFRDSLKEVV
jgi:hypothetical protein